MSIDSIRSTLAAVADEYLRHNMDDLALAVAAKELAIAFEYEATRARTIRDRATRRALATPGSTVATVANDTGMSESAVKQIERPRSGV